MDEIIEGAHPRPKPQFGGIEKRRARAVKQVEGQQGAGLITERTVHIPMATSYYSSKGDIPKAYPATVPIDRTYELDPAGRDVKVSATHLDEHGEIIPEAIGTRGDYIPVVVGQTKKGEDIIKWVPFNGDKNKDSRYT